MGQLDSTIQRELEDVSASIPTETPWRLLSVEFTLVFPAGMSPDLSIVNAIRREFDPYFVPLWVRKAYRDPQGDELVFGFHCIGRWSPQPDDPARPPIKVERPTHKTALFPFEGGVLYDQRTMSDTWAEGTRERALATPDIFVPFDQRLFNFAQASHFRLMREQGSIAEKERIRMDAKEDRERRELEKIEENARLSLKDDRHMIQRAIEQELFAPDPPKEPQPYVQATTIFEASK